MSVEFCPKTGKKMYVNYAHAKADKVAITHKHDSKDRILSIFVCKHCQHWHIGSKYKEGEPY
jgi:hypothetical protein